MKRRIRRKLYKKHLTILASHKEFKSPQAKKQWIHDTYHGDGTMFTRYYLKGEPESPFIFAPYRHLTKVKQVDTTLEVSTKIPTINIKKRTENVS